MQKAEMPSLTDAQRKLVEDNVKLVHWFLNRYTRVLPSEYDDVFQTCCLGLMEAARRYDPGIGKFSTYATIAIKNTYRKMRRHEKTKGRQPTIPPLSLDYEIINKKDGSVVGNLREMIPDPSPTPEEQYENEVLLGYAHELISRDGLLHSYFEDELSRNEIAHAIGMTQVGINRKLNRHINKAGRALKRSEMGGI